MPRLLQWIGQIVPATYYLEIIRGILLKGRAWFPFEGGIMAGMALLLLALAVKRFGTTVE